MLVIIRGAGDIATGIALRLKRAYISVIMTDIPAPTAIRRTVAFSQAIVLGETRVEDVTARRADTPAEALALLKQYGLVDEDGNVITDWSDDIWLQAEPVPLSFGEAMDLSEGTVTVNGRTCDAGELR